MQTLKSLFQRKPLNDHIKGEIEEAKRLRVLAISRRLAAHYDVGYYEDLIATLEKELTA